MLGQNLSPEETTTLRLVAQRKSITKVRLIDVDCLSRIQFLIDLGPSMQYLQIDNTNDIDLQCFVRFILMKNSKYLPSLFFLSFGCSQAIIDVQTKLDKMVAFEQVRRDYAIQKIDEKIYLRWTVWSSSFSASNKRDNSPLLQLNGADQWKSQFAILRNLTSSPSTEGRVIWKKIVSVTIKDQKNVSIPTSEKKSCTNC